MGSLYTSICPILCLDGMGEIIASREVPKVGMSFLINSLKRKETLHIAAISEIRSLYPLSTA